MGMNKNRPVSHLVRQNKSKMKDRSMKKIISILLFIVMVTSLASCSASKRKISSYSEQLNNMGNMETTEMLEQMPTVVEMAVGHSVDSIDKEIWHKGINNDNYFAHYTLAGISSSVGLIVSDGKIYRVSILMYDITPAQYNQLVDCASAVYGDTFIIEGSASCFWNTENYNVSFSYFESQGTLDISYFPN